MNLHQLDRKRPVWETPIRITTPNFERPRLAPKRLILDLKFDGPLVDILKKRAFCLIPYDRHLVPVGVPIFWKKTGKQNQKLEFDGNYLIW